MTPLPGRLIGASLGPGDPGLITRRAWAALTNGARWAYPVKKAEESSYALSIVERGGIPVPPDAAVITSTDSHDGVESLLQVPRADVIVRNADHHCEVSDAFG